MEIPEESNEVVARSAEQDDIRRILGYLMQELPDVERMTISHHSVDCDGELVDVSAVVFYVGGHIGTREDAEVAEG